MSVPFRPTRENTEGYTNDTLERLMYVAWRCHRRWPDRFPAPDEVGFVERPEVTGEAWYLRGGS